MQRDQANEFAGIRLTHPDRILFPDEQITKRDVAAYYTAVASVMLPHVVDRPLSLLRCPDGSMKPCFYQKHLGSTMPEAVRGISIKEKKGTAIYMVIADLAGLISLVQMGVLEIHPWGSRQDRIDQPDRLIFDIDPAEDLAWEGVKQAASVIKGRLEQLGLEGFLRTTGGKGLHVVVPIARRISWQDLKTIAKAFVDVIVRDQPNRYIAQASKAKRPGKIYLDYLRNERGATAVASYSTRARSGRRSPLPLRGMSSSHPRNACNSTRALCPNGFRTASKTLGTAFSTFGKPSRGRYGQRSIDGKRSKPRMTRRTQ